MNISPSTVRYFKHPLVFLKSLYLNVKFSPKGYILKMPITSAWKTKLKINKTAKLEIENRVYLGYFSTRIGEIGQIAYDRTILQLGKDSHLKLGGLSKIGAGVRIILGVNANVEIGKNTFISSNSKIICSEKIQIGDDCAISWGVQIIDSDFHKVVYKDGQESSVTKPIKIGNNVWIGSNVSILKGVTIEDGAIIASDAVVTKDVLKNTLVGGNPSKIIKENVSWIM